MLPNVEEILALPKTMSGVGGSCGVPLGNGDTSYILHFCGQLRVHRPSWTGKVKLSEHCQNYGTLSRWVRLKVITM